MINMKLLSVVTLPSIYHGCSTLKTFWEEKFTGEVKLFSAVNMKIVVVAIFMFTAENNFSSPVNFSSQNVFGVEQP